MTAGLVKIAGVGAAGPDRRSHPRGADRRRPMVAPEICSGCRDHRGSANLVNLLDSAPGEGVEGRVCSPGAHMRRAAGTGQGHCRRGVGGRAALLPDDLDETTMLGDGGANALGALLGTAVVARTRPLGKVAVFCGILGLTLASERSVSPQ